MNAADEMQAKIDAAMSGRRLYDPPVDGKTPLDGAGSPRTSLVMGDITKKLAQGFTLEAVGLEGPELPVEVAEQIEPPPSIIQRASVTRADTTATASAPLGATFRTATRNPRRTPGRRCAPKRRILACHRCRSC